MYLVVTAVSACVLTVVVCCSGAGRVCSSTTVIIGLTCFTDWAGLNPAGHAASCIFITCSTHALTSMYFLGDRFFNGLLYSIGPLSVCLSCLSVTLVYCGQTVGWIKTKLGMQVGLGPGHIVLDGDPPPPPPKGHSLPNFRPISGVAKWLDGLTCHLVWR